MSLTSGLPTTILSSAPIARPGRVELIVVHSDPLPGAEALARFSLPGLDRVPHYYVDIAGTLNPLIPEDQVASHSGTAYWHGRLQAIDPISIGVLLEHTPGTPLMRGQLLALHLLSEQLGTRYGLDDDAIFRWDYPLGQPDMAGVLTPIVLPPDPAIAPDDTTLLPLEPDEYLSDSPMILGVEEDQRLWDALQQEAFRWRGEGFRREWAFHLNADRMGLGAPLARSSSTGQRVQVDGAAYGFQPFARDTLYNLVPHWGEVQSLNDALGGTIPADGLARALLEAAFQAAGAPLFDSYRFHQIAVSERLGYPISGNYATTLAGQRYAVQVFALDTLYTPIADPDSATNWRDVRRLSQTEPGPLAEALWAETYKPCGAPYVADHPLQQHATQARDLGAPLSGVIQIKIDDTIYDLQVFAGDTIYMSAGSPVGRKSALPHDPARASAAPEPEPFVPAATGPAGPGILPPSGVESAWLDEHPNAPLKAKNLLIQALCLLGHEDTIFDSLPSKLRSLTWGAAAQNQAPGSLNYKDICCADYVTLCLAAAGLDYRWRGPGGTTNTRLANYFNPCPENATHLRELGNDEPWLPGDILTCSYGSAGANHVMLYVGPLKGTLAANGRVCDANHTITEASINASGIKPAMYKYNLPSAGLNWYQQHTSWLKRARLLELEQAYKEARFV